MSFSSPFTPEELHEMKRKAFADLEARHPEDGAIKLIQSIDLMLNQSVGRGSASRSPDPANQSTAAFKTASGDEIVAAIIKIQRENKNTPLSITDWVGALRRAGVRLPEQENRANSSVSYHVTRRTDIFEEVRELSTKDGKVWRVFSGKL